jgi:hypothetical protein
MLDAWSLAAFAGNATANAVFQVRVYEVTGSGTTTAYTLLPDSALPGNGVGFTASPIDLSGVSVASYPALALGAEFTTADPNETAELFDWSIAYIEEQEPAAGVTIGMAGEKSIGTHNDAPVPKYEGSRTTGSDGEAAFSDIEADVYTITVDGATEGYDIVEAQSLLPYALAPGANALLTLILDTHTANSLRVTVTDTAGAFIPDAAVTLSRGGYDETLEASQYGQAYFGGLPEIGEYTLVVNADGYTQYNTATANVDGTSALTVVLSPQ